MNILDTIIAHKRKEVAERQSLYPAALLERSLYFNNPCVSLRKYLSRPDMVGLIAEFKRKSPSKGAIAPYADPGQICLGYMQAGASALSVLTDEQFFGGKSADLTAARRFNFCPVLRKDFVIDAYQITEARSIGADAILLIAAVLSPAAVKEFAQIAKGLGMEVLLEIHNTLELGHICAEIDLVGVNNRDLRDFSVDLGTSLALAPQIPSEFIKVSESGIRTAADATVLASHGFQGFLIGEQFMASTDPARACGRFVADLKALLKQEALS
jgi:indole-3-glycerol phosphate synthase